MDIVLATDHAGFAHKEAMRDALTAAGHVVHDCGARTYDETDDYPDFIAPAMEQLRTRGGNARAIIFGGSGQGEAMLANRYEHVRAVVYYGGTTDIITLSRAHNDANVLSLGARFLSPEEAVQAVETWLATPFSGDARHVRRLKKFSYAQ